MMFCWNCGKQIPDNAEFCSFCGKETLKDDVSNNTGKSVDGFDDNNSGKEQYVPIQKKSNKKVLIIAIPIVSVCIIVVSFFALKILSNNNTYGISNNKDSDSTGANSNNPSAVASSENQRKGHWVMSSSKSYTVEGILTGHSKYERNSTGRLIKRVVFSTGSTHGETAGKVKSYDIYEYDENGHTKSITYYQDGMKTGKSEYEYKYDSDGRINEQIYKTYDEHGKLSTTQINVYEYEPNLTRVKITMDPSYGETHEERRYDDSNHLIEYLSYKKVSNQEATTRIKYEYNNLGQVIKEIWTTSMSGVTNGSSSWTEYEYDQNGNAVKSRRYNNGQLQSYSEMEYEYYP